MYIDNISDVEKIIDDIISRQIKRYLHGNTCLINAIFIDFLNKTIRLTEYGEYIITFYLDADNYGAIDKIRQNIKISKEINWEYILQAFHTVIGKYSYFSPLFDLKNKDAELVNCCCINHVEILKIIRLVSRLSENIIPRNRIIFRSNISMLIYDNEFKILEKRLEELGRYDLLL